MFRPSDVREKRFILRQVNNPGSQSLYVLSGAVEKGIQIRSEFCTIFVQSARQTGTSGRFSSLEYQ